MCLLSVAQHLVVIRSRAEKEALAGVEFMAPGSRGRRIQLSAVLGEMLRRVPAHQRRPPLGRDSEAGVRRVI